MTSFGKHNCWAAPLGIALLAASTTTAFGQGMAQPGMTAQQLAGGAGRLMNVPGNMPGPALPNPMPYPPYNPYFPYDPYGYAGGPLTGAANLVGAQGQMMVSQQQAYMMREGVRSAKIDNKKRAFDEYLYEKERTPSAEEERQRIMKEKLSRARNNPPAADIWTGTALNDLLADLRRNVGNTGPDSSVRTFQFPLDQDVLKHINVSSGRGDGNVGLLKNGGKLFWPQVLMDASYNDERDRISTQVADAIKQAEFNQRVGAGTIKQLRDDSASLSKQLKKSVADIDMSDYIQAKEFLNNLDAAIAILQQPDVGNYFSGKYDLKAGSVPELVNYMTKNGLTFAKATPGEESAYMTLWQAMANYDNALASMASSK
jgi:hypothetical protein